MRRVSFLLAALSITASAMTYDCSPGSGTAVDSAAQELELARQQMELKWVDSVFNSLTPRQRVAQLFIPHMVISDNAAGRSLIKQYVGVDGVGGILLGSSQIRTYATLNSYAQSLAKVPLMITADAEWGLSMRLKDAPRFPYNLALGASADTAVMAAYGREMARECKRLGITVSFAPVADVNSNAANPVIGYRSFGEDPARVADLAAAYARGLEEGGVISVGKHFPGHGDTSADSHKTLPVVDRSKKEIEKVELVPFARLIEENRGGIMVGHIKVPALDASGTPASLSKPIVTDLLKKKMGFDGLVFTDALEMAGAQVKGSNNCVLALQAGADVLLGSSKPTADIDAVMKAIKDGKLKQTQVDESVRKLLAYKYRLGLTSRPTIKVEGAAADINSDEAKAMLERLARASIVVVRNSDNILPISRDERIAVVAIGADDSNQFTVTARRLGENVTASSSNLTQADVVLAPVFSTNSAAVSRLASLKSSVGNKLVPVFFCTAYKMSAFAAVLKNLPTLVLAGDDTPELRRAAAEAVFGTETAAGRMPVTVKGVAEAGTGLSLVSDRLGRSLPLAMGASPKMSATIDSLISRGLSTGAFTGCQVMVVRNGEIIFDRSAGNVDGKTSPAVTGATLFDLASVSKVVGTMAGLMAAYDRGLFKFDDPISKFIPELKGDPKGDLTMRSLMLHETGLPAGLNICSAVIDPESLGGAKALSAKRDADHTIPVQGMWGHKDAAVRRDFYSPVEFGTFDMPVANGLYASQGAYNSMMQRVFESRQNGSKSYKYSDLNFLLLMEAEQRITGKNHDEWVDETVYAPLEIQRLVYRPLDLFDAGEIAATEIDNFLRKQKLQGYVHDETAAFMGGVAGNAGLFGNAESIAVWCQMLLDGGKYGGKQILKKSTVDAFLTPRSGSGRRGLGFDVNETSGFIGHTGFTGTCFWMDRARNLIVIVLTNRINPSRNNKAWNALNFRSRILQAVDTAFPR